MTKATSENSVQTVQLFQPGPDLVYTIEAAEHIAHVPRRTIIVYYKHGLVSPLTDPERGGYYFNDEAIRTLRHVEYLHTKCGINLFGVKMILNLLGELERSRAEARFLRQ